MTAEEIKTYEIFKAALQVVLPEVLPRLITLQYRVDALPDLCRPVDVARALGIDKSVITRMIRNGHLDTKTMPETSRAKIHKSSVEALLKKVQI